jgi:crossover junction endodeoxyribonuclease RuvC
LGRGKNVRADAKVIALDLSSYVGWCGGVAGKPPVFNTFRLPSTGEEIGPFALAYRDWLNGMLASVAFDLVVFEAPILPRETQIATVRKLTGLTYHTELICAERGIVCREAHQQTVRKFLAGHGRASKEQMVAAARSYGWPVEDHHQADACGIWAWSCAQFAPQAAHVPTPLSPLFAGVGA